MENMSKSELIEFFIIFINLLFIISADQLNNNNKGLSIRNNIKLRLIDDYFDSNYICFSYFPQDEFPNSAYAINIYDEKETVEKFGQCLFFSSYNLDEEYTLVLEWESEI